MSRAQEKDGRTTAVMVMALVCVALALMCVSLAWAWTQEREEAACWRAAAEFQLQPEGDCRGSFWASSSTPSEAPAR